MTAYASGLNRQPFTADGRMVARRALQHGGHQYQAGEDVPRLDLTDRQVGVLWDQGWVDTIAAGPPISSPPAKHERRK